MCLYSTQEPLSRKDQLMTTPRPLGDGGRYGDEEDESYKALADIRDDTYEEDDENDKIKAVIEYISSNALLEV